MLANHPQREDVEIPQRVQLDQQALPEPVPAVPSTSPLPGDLSTPLSSPALSQTSTSLQQRALRYLERKRIRQERAAAQMQMIKTHGTEPDLQTREDPTDAIPEGHAVNLVPTFPPVNRTPT